MTFRDAEDAADHARWIVIGGERGPPRLAVPVPRGTPLTVGRAAGCWLVLPGEEVAERHAELLLPTGAGLKIRHLDGEGERETWINQASVIAGTLREEDTLRIGPYVLTLRRQDALPSGADHQAPETVIVTDEDVEEDEGPSLVGSMETDRQRGEGETGGRKLRVIISSVVILGSLFYLARTMLFPGVSSDMPTDVECRCPVDGTVFRAPWTEPLPQCPQCGHLVLGRIGMRKPAVAHAPTTRPSPRRDSAATRSAAGQGSETRNPGARRESGREGEPP